MPAMHAKRRYEDELAGHIQTLHRLRAYMTPVNLRALIELTNALIDDEFEQRVAALKKSRDGAGLPIQFLQQQLHRGQCRCVSAMQWLENDQEISNAS